jgi:hypothetical protein
MRRTEKKGQIALFVILALAIVGAIVVFFIFGGGFLAAGISPEFTPVYALYEECIAAETRDAVALLSMQGGRIDAGSYVPGSEFAPFSSQLNFFGTPVPYWNHLSGNNVFRESVPSRQDMEKEMADFVAERVNGCDFSTFQAQGFEVSLGSPSVSARIDDNKVSVNVRANVVSSREDRTARRDNHRVEVSTKLGKFHKTARGIYDKQRKEAFLEEYAVDVLRLYAPVDGVEIQCGPEIWMTREVVDELYSGLEANMQAIKFDGNYFTLNKEEDRYFVVDHKVDEAVNLMFSRAWPSRIEIYGEGVSQEIMIAHPVGNQPGMGAMGFCYVPYHFVYDVSFPVMVQIHDEAEMFQFPVVVVIDKNMPRQAVFSELEEDLETFDLCAFPTEEIEVRTYNNYLESMNADVSYNCFNQVCPLGRSQNGVLRATAPACINGFIIADAEGYAEEKQLFSSNSERSADVILNREYKLDINLLVDGNPIGGNGRAIISFVKESGNAKTVIYPEMNELELTQGNYEVIVQVYGGSGLTLPATRRFECFNVARSGVLGMFGGTREECVEISIPATTIDSIIIGGGNTNTYFVDSSLERGRVTLNVEGLPVPRSIDDLAKNFEIMETQNVWVSFI